MNFSDVAANAWYGSAVSFVAARDITTGTGNGNFSPMEKLTRGQFLVMVMRAYGIAANSASTDNFSDAGNTYYTGYLAAAEKPGNHRRDRKQPVCAEKGNHQTGNVHSSVQHSEADRCAA